MKPLPAHLQSLAAFLTFSLQVPAATLHWDGIDTSADADGGSGTWDLSATHWDSLATGGGASAWPTVAGSDDDASFGGAAATVTIQPGGVIANDLTFTTAGHSLTGGTLTLNGTTPSITTQANATLGVVVAGTAGLNKAGTATLTLTQAATYTGTTGIAAGTLALSGGNDRLPTTSPLSFSGTGTLDLGGGSQTLANLGVLTASANTKGTLTNGSLTLNGASALTISPSVTTGGRTAEVDATGLASLTLSKSGQTITVGGVANAVTPGNSAMFRLSATSNTITASALNIGTTTGANATGVLNKGELELGAANTIQADTWTLGNTRDGGIVRFQTGLSNPSLTLRAQNGTDRVTKITVGQNAAGGTTVGTSSFDLSSGAVDLRVTDLVLSRGGSGSGTSNTPAVNGSFSMGGGSVDATRIWLSKNEAGGRNTTNTSSFTQAGGEVTVTSLVFGETTYSSTTGPTFDAQYTLGAGTLKAGEIKAGAGTFSTSTVRRINFNGGTITHYDAASDLVINGTSGTGGSIGLVLGTSGSPTLQADADRSITLGSSASISGSGSLTKSGAGTLVLTGAATHSGGTSIQGGTVRIGATDRLPTAAALALANTSGVLLDLNGFNQTVGPLSGGGTNGGNISLGAGVLKVNSSLVTTFGGTFSGTGAVAKTGTGTLSLSGNSVVSLAGLNVSGGTLELKAGSYTLTGNAATGQPDASNGLVVSRGGKLRIDGASITATGGSYVFTAGNTGGGSSEFILDSGTFNATGREVLNAYGAAGTTTLNGGLFIAEDFRISQSAVGTVNLNGGILRVKTLKHSNNTEIVNFDGGTLQAKADTADLITSGVDEANVLDGGATIDSNGFTVTVPKALTEAPTSTGGGLTKTGAGTLVLSAANSYTGPTQVSAGTLIVHGSTATSSLTTVNAGAILGGSGTIGATTVLGTHAPGNSPGVQTFTGDLTYANGSNLVWELIGNSTLGRGTTFDGIDLTGAADLVFSGATTLNLDFALAGSTVDWSDALWDQSISGTQGWKLFNLDTGTIQGIGNLNLGTANWADASGDRFDLARPGSSFSWFVDGNDLYLNYSVASAIPEPGSLFGIAVLLGTPLLVRRRKQP